MNSRTTVKFRKAFANLPEEVQEQAREAYRQFKQDPWHSSLRFKEVHQELPIYSARLSKNYRVVGQRDGDFIVWFWIGSHADYNKLLSQF
ncbi:MAG: hypothetical protein V7K27_21490 [Nostoc sp.]|uniref:type II toxin-antitoxin system RelE family toxin n=1 Tax=Nostoc sp. TaxID=1180 RepID=UPI002FF90D56